MYNYKRSYLNSAYNTLLLFLPVIPFFYFFLEFSLCWLLPFVIFIFLYIKSSPYFSKKNSGYFFVLFPLLKEIPISELDMDRESLTFKRVNGSVEFFVEREDVINKLMDIIVELKK